MVRESPPNVCFQVLRIDFKTYVKVGSKVLSPPHDWEVSGCVVLDRNRLLKVSSYSIKALKGA